MASRQEDEVKKNTITESKIQKLIPVPSLFKDVFLLWFGESESEREARNRLACSRRLVSGEQSEVKKSKKNDLQVTNRQTTDLLAGDG